MKCGIEIHQRIASGKLFCACSPEGRGGDYRAEFTRSLHPVQSELGELDPASKLESARARRFRCVAAGAQACLVEADEEPPHGPNPGALRAVLLFCELLSARPVDE